MSKHHLLSPSSGPRWFVCAGSPQAEAGYPRTTNKYAEEGTEIHDLGAHGIESTKPADQLTDNKEWQGIIDTYTRYVYEQAPEGVVPLAEILVELDHIAPGMFGTADAVVLDSPSDTIHVIDLKTGKGRVDVENNVQLLLYASGVYEMFGWMAEWKQVVIHIVQPRLDYIGAQTVTVDELAKFTETAIERAKAALADNPPKTPSQEACRYCKHAGDCNEYRIQTYQQVCAMFEDEEFKEPDDVSEYDHNTLSDKLAAIPAIKAWMQAVEDRAHRALQEGENVPGWKLVEGRKLRKWKDEEAAKAALRRKKFKVGEIMVSKLISPAQAEKLLGKGNPLLDDLVITPTGAPVMAPATDKRPDVRQTAADGFDSLTDQPEA